jgi:glutaredoxin
MYTKPNCPYCAQARAALTERGDEFEERDATARSDWKAELMRYSKGTGMVPTIVVGDEVETVGWQGRG